MPAATDRRQAPTSDSETMVDDERPAGPLRRGWTTGACATAATTAATEALFGGDFPDPVTIRLPRGQEPAFALGAREPGDGGGWARPASSRTPATTPTSPTA